MKRHAHHVVREVAGLSAAAGATLHAGVAIDPHAAAAGLSLPLGSRVLDLVTGQEGVITDGRIEHILVPTADSQAG